MSLDVSVFEQSLLPVVFEAPAGRTYNHNVPSMTEDKAKTLGSKALDHADDQCRRLVQSTKLHVINIVLQHLRSLSVSPKSSLAKTPDSLA